MAEIDKAPSMSTHYQNSEYAKFEQRHFSPTQNGTEVFFVRQGEIGVTDPSLPQLAFGAYTRVDPAFRGRGDFGDGFKSMSHVRKGDILLGPANTTSTYEFEGVHELVIVAVSTKLITDAFEIDVIDVEKSQDQYYKLFTRAPHRDFDEHFPNDERMKASFDLMQTVLRASETRTKGSDLLIESASLAVAAQLLSNFLPERSKKIQKISDARLDRVIDFIEANMNSALSLSQLSEIACMSSAHFARAFKHTMREPPHVYVLRRRIEKAKELLRHSTIPIAFVAHECGFSSQAHLTEHFRTRVGTSPAQYRKMHDFKTS